MLGILGVIALVATKLFLRMKTDEARYDSDFTLPPGLDLDALLKEKVNEPQAKKHDAVEFQVRVGGEAIDVRDGGVQLPSGATMTVQPRPVWVWSNDTISFDYPSDQRVRAHEGEIIIMAGLHQLVRMVDTPTKLQIGAASVDVELIRRAKVLRSFAGLTLSHDSEFSGVQKSELQMQTLVLTSLYGSITILRPAIDDPKGVLDALPLPTSRAPVRRKIAGAERSAVRVTIDGVPVGTEAYAFHVGTIPVIVMTQCPPDACKYLDPLFDDFAATLRVAR